MVGLYLPLYLLLVEGELFQGCDFSLVVLRAATDQVFSYCSKKGAAPFTTSRATLGRLGLTARHCMPRG